MRTGLWMPISNDGLAFAFFGALIFVVISGIWAYLKHLSFRERETIRFSQNTDQTEMVSTSASAMFQAEKPREVREAMESLILPSEQSAIAFFSQLAPHAGLNAEINRTKNTMLFSNSNSTDHRLVIAITGSGRYATAYYSTQINALSSTARLTLKVDENIFALKSSPESLIFRDREAAFYEISLNALDAIATADTAIWCVSANNFSSEIGGQNKNDITKMAQLIYRIAGERSDIIFLGD